MRTCVEQRPGRPAPYPRPPTSIKFASAGSSGQHSADSRRSTLTPRADPHDTHAHMTKPRPPSGPMGPFCALWISFALFHRPSLTGRATIGRLELPPGEGRFVDPPLRAACALCDIGRVNLLCQPPIEHLARPPHAAWCMRRSAMMERKNRPAAPSRAPSAPS